MNPPVAWTVPYGLNLAVRVTMPGRIAATESPSHAISVSRVPDRVAGAAPASDDPSGGRRTAEADRCAQPGDAHTELIVTLAQREAALDRDFVLSIDAADLDAPQAWIERDDEGRETIAVAFVPSLPAEPTPAEIVFVVDRSGSMEGSSIEEVRHTLQLCLRSMISGCRFNIVGFGDRYEALFPESRPYDDASLGEAAGHVATLNANLGGTEILPDAAVSFEVPLHGVPVTTGRVVATLAARARIRELEETSEWLTGRGSQQLERKESLVRREIIEWSLRYGLISRETSFVAVERRETPVQGDVQLRRVPVALTTGWGGLDRRVEYLRRFSSVSAPTRVPHMEFLLTPEAFLSIEASCVEADLAVESHALGGRFRPRRPPELDALVALQGADGTWELTEQLAEILALHPETLEAALAGASGAPEDVRRAWATALALAWLRLNATDCADEWQWLGAKARKRLDRVPATPPGGGTWLDAARGFLLAGGG